MVRLGSQLLFSWAVLGSSSAADYLSNAQTAAGTLNQWYNSSTGIWNSTGWWNGANCLTALADLQAVDQSLAANELFANTFVKAQEYNLEMMKEMLPSGMIRCYYWPDFPPGHSEPPRYSPKGFLNGFYDDEGWWALGWIAVYDITNEPKYLRAAVDIFKDMAHGWTTPCGGIWWDKNHTYVNAIANELFLSVASHLANRADNKDFYVDWALKEWEWFWDSGMINEDYNINDGLTEDCDNNGRTVWTYNQGVILGGLIELQKATGNRSYVPLAQKIAKAGIANLTDENGILHDPCEPSCGADGSQFKGIFARNIQLLQKETNDNDLKDFLKKNADSIWANDRNKQDQLSLIWSGPFVNPANASTQSSALDALVAAAAVQ